MSESTLREIGRYLANHWWYVSDFVLLVVAIALAYRWIRRRRGV